MELRFKNAKFIGVCVSIFFSCIVVFVAIFGVTITYFFENARDFSLVAIIALSILIGIWTLYFLLVIVLGKSIIISNEGITVKKGNRVLWKLKKEDIDYCSYEKIKASTFIFPNPNASYMLFKLKKGEFFTIRNKTAGISLSLKEVEKMMKNFDYEIKILNSIYEQK